MATLQPGYEEAPQRPGPDLVRQLARQRFGIGRLHREQERAITSVLAGSTAALVAIEISDHSLGAALTAGALVFVATLVALMRFQRSAWARAAATPLIAEEDPGPS